MIYRLLSEKTKDHVNPGEMQDAVDGAGLNGYVKIYQNKPGNERNKKDDVMKTAPGVVAEVKNKMCSAFSAGVACKVT